MHANNHATSREKDSQKQGETANTVRYDIWKLRNGHRWWNFHCSRFFIPSTVSTSRIFMVASFTHHTSLRICIPLSSPPAPKPTWAVISTCPPVRFDYQIHHHFSTGWNKNLYFISFSLFSSLIARKTHFFALYFIVLNERRLSNVSLCWPLLTI